MENAALLKYSLDLTLWISPDVIVIFFPGSFTVLFYFIPNQGSMMIIILDKPRHVEVQAQGLAPNEDQEFDNDGRLGRISWWLMVGNCLHSEVLGMPFPAGPEVPPISSLLRDEVCRSWRGPWRSQIWSRAMRVSYEPKLIKRPSHCLCEWQYPQRLLSWRLKVYPQVGLQFAPLSLSCESWFRPAWV